MFCLLKNIKNDFQLSFLCYHYTIFLAFEKEKHCRSRKSAVFQSKIRMTCRTFSRFSSSMLQKKS